MAADSADHVMVNLKAVAAGLLMLPTLRHNIRHNKCVSHFGRESQGAGRGDFDTQ